jgi:DNA-binding CsgD family transcriptional regulator
LARGGTGEPQERQLAPTPERDHRQRVGHSDRCEGEDHRDVRLRATNPWLIDSLLATAFLVIVLVAHFGAENPSARYHDPNLLSVLLTIGVAVPYYFRRHAPVAVLLISEACVVGLTVGDYQTGAGPFVLLVGVYTVAAWCNARERAIGAGAVLIGLVIVAVVGIPGSNGVDIAFNRVVFAAAYLFGSAVRNRAEALLAPKVTRRLIEQFVQQRPAATGAPHPGLASITEREREVLAAVASGLSNAEIAHELLMSHATAKTHVSRLLTKLDAREGAQLVMLAYEASVVVPRSS